jgi:flagellar hook-associated protein 3 FlgL
MAIPRFAPGDFRSTNAASLLVDIRTKLDDLQRQLSTGKKSETFGGLGSKRMVSLDMRAKLSEAKSYQDTIQNFQNRAKQLDLTLDTLQKIADDTRTEGIAAQYDPDAFGKTTMQKQMRGRFDQAVDLLNLKIGEGYPFSGRRSDVPPVLAPDVILNGDSAGRAGVAQLIAERRAADYGVAASAGRVTRGGAGATASLTEDGTHPFGIKLSSASSTSAGIAAVRTAGPPADVTFTVGALPAAGEEVRLQLSLPDGTTRDIVLTARAATTVPPGDAGGFDIGATPAATAANLRTALAAVMDREAVTSLPAASASAAADAFFAGSLSSPPMRVVGPPATATTLAAGTPANTVIWYQGDDTSADPRLTAQAKVDGGGTIGLGVQANEQGIRNLMANLAALATDSFNAASADDRGRFEQMAQRVRVDLSQQPGVQRVQDIHVAIANATNAMKSAEERHKVRVNFFETIISDVEDANDEETAAKLLTLQTKMQAAYQTTSSISRLTLTDYLR